MASQFQLLTVATILGLIMPPTCIGDNILYSPETLHSGNSLSWNSYELRMQSDCNLVLYECGRAIWATGTDGRGYNCRCTMQTDGNLVVYDQSNRAVWASGTAGENGNYVLVLQKDRNLVIYGTARWASNTYRGTLGVAVGAAAQNSTATAAQVMQTTGRSK